MVHPTLILASDASNNYIIKLKDISLFSDIQAEAINEDHRLYRISHSELKHLQNYTNIEYCEPDCKVELFDTSYPNDELFQDQWNVLSTKADSAWDVGATGCGVKIAVIDSGLVKNHPDIDYSNIEEGWDYTSGCADTTDAVGHGSFATGIIACTFNNSIGIAGLCDKTSIVPLKCFDTTKTTTMSVIVQAIYDAVDKYKCDIINMSLGSSTKSDALKEAIEYAENNNVIVIAAVGNYGTTQIYYPAGFDTVIGVGSIGRQNMVSSFSQKNASVMVTAPGEGITSISNEPNEGIAYVTGSGTSFAAPHIAACAAVLKCIDYNLTPEKFREIIKTSSDDFGTADYDTSYGFGALNMQRCIETAVSNYDAFIFPMKCSPSDCYNQISISSAIIINKNNDNGCLSIICTYDDNQMIDASIQYIAPQAAPFIETHLYTAPKGFAVKHFLTDTAFRPLCAPQILNCK